MTKQKWPKFKKASFKLEKYEKILDQFNYFSIEFNFWKQQNLFRKADHNEYQISMTKHSDNLVIIRFYLQNSSTISSQNHLIGKYFSQNSPPLYKVTSLSTNFHVEIYFYSITVQSPLTQLIQQGSKNSWFDSLPQFPILYSRKSTLPRCLHDDYFDYVYTLIIYLPIMFCMNSYFQYKQTVAYQIFTTTTKSNNLKQKIFYFKTKLDQFDNDIEAESWIRGLVKDHSIKKCSNPFCFSHKSVHYDSKNNNHCSLDKIGTHKSIFCKLLMRCWYQTESDERNIKQKIDFAEFLFFKLKNTCRAMKILTECQLMAQFPFDKLRIARLRKEIQIQNTRLNKELYNGMLDIEFIIESQKTFENVKSKISDVLRNNRLFWQTVYNNKVDLTELVQTITPNVDLMNKINNEWKYLSKYFDIQKKWKFYYAWYILYVKNQKLKSVILEYFTVNVKQEDVFDETNMHYSQEQQNESQIIFQGKSATIHVSCSEKSVIKKISSSFTKLFGYQEKEILESPLEVLMTQTLSHVHQEILHQWSYEGKSATQPNYHIRKVYIKHKLNHIIGANKHLKQIINSSNQLEYVALFKIFDDEQNVLIADSLLNVESLTQNLFKQLQFNEIQGSNDDEIRKINVSFFINKLSELLDYEQIDPQSNRNIFQQVKAKKDKQLRENKEINFKCQFRIPHNFKQILAKYKTNTQNSKLNQITLIKETIEQLSKHQSYKQFSCTINVIPKILSDRKYYQIHFSELVNLNKINPEKRKTRRTQKQPSSLIASEFHKHFQSDQTNKTFSLSYSNNIFIKEDTNKSATKLIHIYLIKNLMRLFYSIITIFCITTTFVIYSQNFNNYERITKQIAVIKKIDLNVFYFQNNLYNIKYYNQNILPDQFNTQTFLDNSINQLQTIYFKLSTLKQSSELKSVLFNPILNPQNTYGTTYSFLIDQGLDSLGVKFDETDFVLKVFEIIQLIKSNNFQTFELNDWAFDFLHFYLTPAFQNLLSTVSANLFLNLQIQITQIDKVTKIIYIFLSLSFALFYVLSVRRITKIIDSFVSIIGIFTNFNQQDIQKIYKYSNFISNFFKYLKTKDKQTLQSPNQQNSQFSSPNAINNLTFNNSIFHTSDNNNININKKIKKIEVGSVLNKIRFKVYGFTVLILVIFVGGCFYWNTLIRNHNQKINYLSKLGQQHFKYYSTLTKVSSALNKKKLNSKLYQEYFTQNYQQQIENLLKLKTENKRVPHQRKHNVEFIDKYNAVYFQNVCEYLIKVTQETQNTQDVQNIQDAQDAQDTEDIQDTEEALDTQDTEDPQDNQDTQNDQIAQDLLKCKTVTQNSLQYGIQSYVSYFTDKAIIYLNNTNTSIDFPKIFQLQQGLTYTNRFLEELTKQYLNQFSSIISQQWRTIIACAIGGGFALIGIYLLLIQLFMMKNLNTQYQVFQNVYEMYMPDYLATKEKVIKAKLVTDGILNQ